MGPRAGLNRFGKSRPIGIRSPDRPDRSQSLYRLRYPAHLASNNVSVFALNTFTCACGKCDIIKKITDMRRLTTGIRSEKCVFRRFCRCVNVYLHKPR